jgi:hypothetical protein
MEFAYSQMHDPSRHSGYCLIVNAMSAVQPLKEYAAQKDRETDSLEDTLP